MIKGLKIELSNSNLKKLVLLLTPLGNLLRNDQGILPKVNLTGLRKTEPGPDSFNKTGVRFRAEKALAKVKKWKRQIGTPPETRPGILINWILQRRKTHSYLPWTINTKYYTADVSVWMAHLHEDFSIGSLPVFDQLAALVMVFDLNDLSTLVSLKDWVSRIDLQKFEILLCIGNKVDRLPGHPVHAEYRRRLLKRGESSADTSPDFSQYGISETEGSSLLGDEEPSWEIKRSCLEWCTELNIEYVEACASNVDFDKCLSVDGDSQGVERLYGALSAHMWPGMILKSGDKISEPSLPGERRFYTPLSEEESDFEFDYEVLSAGSAEPWGDTDEVWVSANGTSEVLNTGRSVTLNNSVTEQDQENVTNRDNAELQPSTSTGALVDEIDNELMSEIGNIRNNLRLMPDFQRREMAATLAMKMATMFGGSSDEEEGLD
ncbi:hypothetical protein Patl1_29314 [Pistacia atlantica]|uniref:Uncharacterized protein n=1 Tax=Pistacia atlantica TaxID=434234 RepID=A0ACC1BGL6_9ROSI|nr:hypothetical protein Patl1_29314 [Pistacia atlantica]